jgi:hypothetical protein
VPVTEDVISQKMAARRDEYLRHAANADKWASEAEDVKVWESWKGIAESYRQLAANVSSNIQRPP